MGAERRRYRPGPLLFFTLVSVFGISDPDSDSKMVRRWRDLRLISRP